MLKNAEKNTNPSYVISPCYRLSMPTEEEQKLEQRSADRRLDTPRSSAVRRPPIDW